MRKRVFRLVGLLGVAVVVAGTFLSCLDGADIAFGDCPNPDFAHLNRYGDLDPCCIDKTNACGSDECDGECMPTNADINWSKEPVLFWFGDVDQAPTTCPDSTEDRWEGYADPISVGECIGCVCGDPACVLPASVIASDAAGCNGPTFTNLSIASDGSCSTGDVKPNALQSLAILSPTVSACTPSLAPITVPKDLRFPDIWGKKGVVCSGSGNGKCSATGDVCVPSTKPPSGFMQCIYNLNKGDELSPCPDEGKENGYSRKIIIYEEIDDKVACTECKCGAPVGSECTAAVSAYQDMSCATPIFENYVVFSGNPQCATVGPNLPLQGVTSTWITNQPGACTPSGGQRTGKVDVDPTTAHAFCCRE
jgi:hypothetical protein